MIKKIDEMNSLALLKHDKKGLINKLKEIESNLDVICKDNNHDSFSTKEATKLKTDIGNKNYLVGIRKCKFKITVVGIIGYYEKEYLLDELLEEGYNPAMLNVLYEIYSTIPEILNSYLQVM